MCMSSFSCQSIIGGLCLAIFCSGLAEAQDGARKNRAKGRFLAEAGSIEGAIWSFELKPKPGSKRNASTIRGRYRVSDLKIYQAETRGGEMTKEIGVSKPNLGQKEQKTTIVEYESLRGTTGPNQVKELIKGKALLEVNSFGELSGEFIDSDGFKWEMVVKRVRE